VHCESAVEVHVIELMQSATAEHVTQESAMPSWRNVPLSHTAHCDVVALVQVSCVEQ
jgi:hypothetical protein